MYKQDQGLKIGAWDIQWQELSITKAKPGSIVNSSIARAIRSAAPWPNLK